MKIIGSYVSPYVRKVLACLALKGLSYEIDPITPFFGDDAIALVGVDQEPSETLLAKIQALPHVKEARALRF